MESIVHTVNDIVWNPGLMAWVTVVSLLILCPQAIKELKDYEGGRLS